MKNGEMITKTGEVAEAGEIAQKKNIGEAANQISAVEKQKDMVRFWAERYRTAEMDYLKDKKARKSRMTAEEFEEWEDNAGRFFERMQETEKKAGVTSANRYERDGIERIGSLNANTTIEADAGDYYMPRLRTLNEAIQSSDSPDKEDDLKAGENLYQRVGEHLYYEYDYETKRNNVEAYNANRRHAHNKLIEQLNRMNAIARKYGVRPFTFRDFETNDFEYKESLDPRKETDARSDYDRTAVEAYCRNAFSSAYEKAERDNR